MGVLRADPVGVFGSYLHPQPIGQVRVELYVWVESIASLHHLFGITAFHHLSLQDLQRWEVVVHHIEVFIGMFFQNFIVDF